MDICCFGVNLFSQNMFFGDHFPKEFLKILFIYFLSDPITDPIRSDFGPRPNFSDPIIRSDHQGHLQHYLKGIVSRKSPENGILAIQKDTFMEISNKTIVLHLENHL